MCFSTTPYSVYIAHTHSSTVAQSSFVLYWFSFLCLSYLGLWLLLPGWQTVWPEVLLTASLDWTTCFAASGVFGYIAAIFFPPCVSFRLAKPVFKFPHVSAGQSASCLFEVFLVVILSLVY